MLYARALRVGSATDAVWFKNAVSAAVLAALAFALPRAAGGGAVDLGEAGWLSLSGMVAVCFGDFLYFVAIAHIGVGRTVILTQATPAATALAAWPLYGEALAPLQWTGILAVCVGGVLAESRKVAPRPTDRRGFLAAAACIVAWTTGNLLTQRGMADAGAVSAAALRLGGAAAGFLPLFLFRRELGRRFAALVDGRMWRSYGLATFLGTVCGMGLYTAAVKWAPLGVAIALTSALPLFTVPLAVLLLGERPGARGWLGALAVVGGVAMLGLGSEAGGVPPG